MISQKRWGKSQAIGATKIGNPPRQNKQTRPSGAREARKRGKPQREKDQALIITQKGAKASEKLRQNPDQAVCPGRLQIAMGGKEHKNILSLDESQSSH